DTSLGALSGAGTLSQNNSNSKVTLNGNDSGFTGAIIVNAGTLVVGTSNTALGTTDAPTTVMSGATLDLNGRLAKTETVVLMANITIKDAAHYFGTTTTLGDQPGIVSLVNGGQLGLDGAGPVTKIITTDSSNSGLTSFNNDNTVASQITMNGPFQALTLPVAAYGTTIANTSLQVVTLTLSGKLTGPGSLNVHN